MAGRKAESFVLHSGGTATEYPLLDAETYESLVSAVIRIAKLENTEDSHDEILTAVQAAVAKLQESDTDATKALQDLDERITKAQNTADSNTKKYQALSETVTNEQTKLANEIERAKDVEGDISDLNTAVRDNLVAAINYLLARADKNAETIGTLSSLTTAAKTNIVSAVNELDALKAEQTDVETLEATVDNTVTKVEALESTVNNAVSSINAAVDKVNTMQETVDSKANQSDVTVLETKVNAKADTSVIGDLANLTTTEKSTLVGAINEAAASGGSSGGTSVNVISPQTVTIAPSTTSEYDVAIGFSAKTEASGAIAIGVGSDAADECSIAIGIKASGVGNSVAIGPDAHSQGMNSVTMGYTAGAGGINAIAIGTNSKAGAYSIAMGLSSRADPETGYAVAIGCSTNAHGCGDNSVAIGKKAEGNAENSVAIGSGAQVQNSNSVAIGSDSYTDADYTVSVGSSSQKRRITNVADPTEDQDAATKAYVDNISAASKIGYLTKFMTAKSGSMLVGGICKVIFRNVPYYEDAYYQLDEQYYNEYSGETISDVEVSTNSDGTLTIIASTDMINTYIPLAIYRHVRIK